MTDDSDKRLDQESDAVILACIRSWLNSLNDAIAECEKRKIQVQISGGVGFNPRYVLVSAQKKLI